MDIQLNRIDLLRVEILVDGLRVALTQHVNDANVRRAVLGVGENAERLRTSLAAVWNARRDCLLLFPASGAFSPVIMADCSVGVVRETFNVFIEHGYLRLPKVLPFERGTPARPLDPKADEDRRAQVLAARPECPLDWMVRDADDPLLDAVPATPKETVEEATRLLQAVVTAGPPQPPGPDILLASYGWHRAPLVEKVVREQGYAVPDFGKAWCIVADGLGLTHAGRRLRIELGPESTNFHRAGSHWRPHLITLSTGPFSVQELVAARRAVAAHAGLARLLGR